MLGAGRCRTGGIGHTGGMEARLTAAAVHLALQEHASNEKAQVLARFFKTGKGQYGEGDVFMGVVVPAQRKVAKRFAGLPLEEVERLLHRREHECRLTALLILVEQYKRGDDKTRKHIYDLYLANTARINNWDLVDLSAEHIVGAWIDGRADKMRVLTRLARSKSLWERRIAMLSTFYFIKKGMHDEAIPIARILLTDTHDLIQKAVGWMLREVGKRASLKAEFAFLDHHAATMPRTTLRYAIERLPEETRRHYLAFGRVGA